MKYKKAIPQAYKNIVPDACIAVHEIFPLDDFSTRIGKRLLTGCLNPRQLFLRYYIFYL